MCRGATCWWREAGWQGGGEVGPPDPTNAHASSARSSTIQSALQKSVQIIPFQMLDHATDQPENFEHNFMIATSYRGLQQTARKAEVPKSSFQGR